ncbi:MAG: thioesterase II family protein [Candidatus Polarisedimenticolia bacterium]
MLVNDAAWWPFGPPAGNGRIPLVCLPYAGGGASVYRAWRRTQPAGVEICPLQLPGREGRIREAPHRRVETLALQLAQVMLSVTVRPYALFGHSMGALIAFELAHRMSEMGRPPAHLFVSASRPPASPRCGPPLHTLTDAAFVEALRELEGTPEPVLAHQELMELLLPALRADFELCETYAPPARPPLTVPITAFGGTQDAQVSPQDLEGWSRETSSGFTAVQLAGRHFFLEDHAASILSRVASSVVG